MELIFSYFLSFASGLAFTLGLLHLYAGVKPMGEKTYLFFGLISLSAAFFYVTRLIGTAMEWPAWAYRLSYLFAFLFYGLFPWFTTYLTGYWKITFNRTISAAVLLSYILLWLDDRVYGMLPLWDWVAMPVVIVIGVHGLLAALHMRKGNLRSLESTRLFLFTILVYNLGLIHYHMDKFLGIEFLLPRSVGRISLVDLFPIFFLLMMGIQLGRDVYERMVLKRKLRIQDRFLNNLLNNLEHFVLRTDTNNRILHANRYFLDKTEYQLSEILGSDWFDQFFSDRDGEQLRQAFQEASRGIRTELPTHQGVLKTARERQFQVSWSHVMQLDEDEKLAGFLSIGYDLTEKEEAIRKIDELKLELEKENLQLQEVIQTLQGKDKIVGQSDALNYALTRARQVAPTLAAVLIKGETGVGKELFAELVHQNSQRAHKPLVKVNCATLPRDLIESELFGHEKGAFTGAHASRKGRFELADGGTIFLDEIGELPPELQPKLLRVLQQGEFMRLGGQKVHKVDVRVISATNRDLKEEVREKRFREDLFYRLDVYPITIPPLRQRKEDIPLLVSFFVKKYAAYKDVPIVDISKRDLQILTAYHWPGNVRELQNTVERALINSPEGTLCIDIDDLKNMGMASPMTDTEGISAYSIRQSLEEVEREHILRVLEDCHWRISGKAGAARRLGIPRTTLQSKMKKLGIERPKTAS